MQNRTRSIPASARPAARRAGSRRTRTRALAPARLRLEALEERLALSGTTILYEDFQADTAGALPASPDNFWNATGPNSFIQVAGAGGTYSDPFNITGNRSLVMDTPGASQAIVSWHTAFSDDPTQFQSGTISFDVYLGEPSPSRNWTYLDFRLGYGGPSRTAPTTVGDTTVWNSFRVNLGSPDVIVDNGGTGQSSIASNTKLHVVYTLDGVSKTYQLTINGTPITFGTGNPNRPWIAGATGVNMLGFFGAFPVTSSPAYVDNLQVIKADPPAPWAPGPEPTDAGEWHQHRGNKRLTGEAGIDNNIVAGAQVIWSKFIGSRESWVGLTPGGGSSTVNLPGSNLAMSSAEQISWNIGGPYWDLMQNGNLTPLGTGSATRIGDFIPGNGVLEKLEAEVFDTTFGQGVIRLFKWSAGGWVQQWQSPTIPSMFGSVNIITGDFNNDGQQDVAIVPWTNVYVLSMANGTVQKTGTFKPAANESGRPYGWFGAYDLNNDGKKEFIVIGDFQDFISVVGWNGAGNLVKLWDYAISPNLTGKQTANRPGAFPVRDVDGDGALDIVTSVYNDNGDQRWHVVVYNALTGALKFDLVDRVVDGSRDVDGDGSYELFVRETQGALLPTTGTVRIVKFQGGNAISLWSQANTGFVSQDIPEFPVNVNSYTATGKLDLLTGPITPGGNSLFFTRRILDAAANTAEVTAWQLDGLGGAASIGTATGVDLDVLAVRSTGVPTSRVLLSSQVVGSSPGSVALTGFTGLNAYSQSGSPPRASAVVGKLDGPNSRPTVVVQGGSETITALQPLLTGGANTAWTRQGLGGYTGATQFTGQHEYSGVALGDVNGDGKLETIYATVGDAGQARLVATRPDGSELWHRDFDVPGGTRIWNQPGLTLWRTGHFTSPDYEDVLVQIMRGSGGTGEYWMLDGRDGDVRWSRTYGNTPGSFATQRNAGENHMVVYDYDGDGLDEAVNVHPDMYYVVDGNGLNLIDRSILGGGVFPGGSPLYGSPVVADFQDNGTPSILYAGGYSQFGVFTPSGTPVWYKPFVFDAYPGLPQGVGDVDGDGDLDLLSPGFRITPANDVNSKFNAYDAKTGNLLWQIDLPGRPYAAVGGAFSDSPTTSISADVDQDGRVESIFAINGTLYAVGANPGGASGQIEWTFTPDGGLLGSPIIADGNGDGKPEIIVVSTSGYIYGIGPQPLIGDLNGDGYVDLVDVQVVGQNWNTAGPAGDANQDGVVNLVDVQTVGVHWHQGTPPGGGGASASQPPVTLSLAADAIAADAAPTAAQSIPAAAAADRAIGELDFANGEGLGGQVQSERAADDDAALRALSRGDVVRATVGRHHDAALRSDPALSQAAESTVASALRGSRRAGGGQRFHDRLLAHAAGIDGVLDTIAGHVAKIKARGPAGSGRGLGVDNTTG